MKTILMCPPDFFEVVYSINPWMDMKYEVEKTSSMVQWKNLRDKLIDIGAEVKLIQPQNDLPDMVFVDAGIIFNDIFIPSNFRFPERQGESKYYAEWFRQNGFRVVELPRGNSESYFEGHGDTLWEIGSKVDENRKLFFGYGFRSTLKAQEQIKKIFLEEDKLSKVGIIPIELIDKRFYHLDTCFCPINQFQALCYLEAISKESIDLLEKHIELIGVSEKDATKFACNSVVIEKDIVIPAGTDETCKKLENIGYKTHQINVDEFIKSGGACKCLAMGI